MGVAALLQREYWWPSRLEWEDSPWSAAENWERALQDIAHGRRDVNAMGFCYLRGSLELMTLLHFAASSDGGGTVAHMRRLLALGANASARDELGKVPMHFCASSAAEDALDKCKLLPTADIAAEAPSWRSPFFSAACYDYNRPVLRWMLEQPECPVEEFLRKQSPRSLKLDCTKGKVLALLQEAVIQRRRWSNNRAAWAATVAAAATNPVAAYPCH
jgi:hypothetical protein